MHLGTEHEMKKDNKIEERNTPLKNNNSFIMLNSGQKKKGED